MTRYAIILVWVCLYLPLASALKAEDLLSWDEALRLALANNQDYQLALQLVPETEGRAIVEKARWMPLANLTGVSLPPTVTFNYFQPIYSPAMKPTFKGAELGISYAQITGELALLELIHRLRLQFADTLYTQEVLQHREKHVELVKDRLKRAPALFHAGLLPLAGIKSMELSQSFIEETLKNSLHQFELQRINLAQVIGLSPSDVRLKRKLVGEFNSKVDPAWELPALIEIAMKTRRDLRLLELSKQITHQVVMATRGNLYPYMYGRAMLITTADPPSFMDPLLDVLDPQSAETDEDDDIVQSRASISGEVAWTLWDGNLTPANVAIQNAQKVKQEILIERMNNKIPQEVESAWVAVNKAKQALELLREEKAVEQTITMTQESFEAGLASRLEVSNALESAIEFNIQKVKAHYALDRALTELARATGTQVQITPQPME